MIPENFPKSVLYVPDLLFQAAFLADSDQEALPLQGGTRCVGGQDD